MTLYHLDANPLVDLMRGRPQALLRRFDTVDPSAVSVSTIVVGELWLGAEKAGGFVESTKVERVLGMFAKVEITEPVANEYARIRAYLEAIGQKMDGNDLWVAATALVHGATLVTADTAFARVPDLRVEDWRAG